MKRMIGRRPLLAIGGAVAVGVAAFALAWFQPHKLFIDQRADEAVPTVSADASTAPSSASSLASAPTVGAEPVVLATGEFISRDHPTVGAVRILDLGSGRRVLRIEGLDTDNGPDLFVYLTTGRAEGEEGAFDDDFVNLGRLTANQGDQNYDVPDSADLNKFGAVVIWCDRFNSAFGAADLELA